MKTHLAASVSGSFSPNSSSCRNCLEMSKLKNPSQIRQLRVGRVVASVAYMSTLKVPAGHKVITTRRKEKKFFLLVRICLVIWLREIRLLADPWETKMGLF